jgi:hypothetical protein
VLAEEPRFAFARIHLAWVGFESGDADEAERVLAELEEPGRFGYEWYVRALLAAKKDAADESIAALVEALDRSFRPGDILRTDPVLSALENHPHADRVRTR